MGHHDIGFGRAVEIEVTQEDNRRLAIWGQAEDLRPRLVDEVVLDPAKQRELIEARSAFGVHACDQHRIRRGVDRQSKDDPGRRPDPQHARRDRNGLGRASRRWADQQRAHRRPRHDLGRRVQMKQIVKRHR